VSRSSSVPPNTRDALYQGLPPNVKSALRSRLQSFQVKEEVHIPPFPSYILLAAYPCHKYLSRLICLPWIFRLARLNLNGIFIFSRSHFLPSKIMNSIKIIKCTTVFSHMYSRLPVNRFEFINPLSPFMLVICIKEFNWLKQGEKLDTVWQCFHVIYNANLHACLNFWYYKKLLFIKLIYCLYDILHIIICFEKIFLYT